MFGRQKVAALFAEFLGTGVLTLVILNVFRSQLGTPYFIALVAGLTVTVMTLAVGSVSGGHFNPALTIGAWTARKISSLSAVLYVVAQFLGAYAAYSLYVYFSSPTSFSIDLLPLAKVSTDFNGHVFVAEAIGAGIFALAFASAVYQGFNRVVSASLAGLSYTVAIVVTSVAALTYFNPAVAYGLKSWALTTYVLGPVVGAVVGFSLYRYIFTESGYAKLTALFSTSSVKSVAKKTVTKKKSVSKKKK